jgi:hypothetical protein
LDCNNILPNFSPCTRIMRFVKNAQIPSRAR